MQDGNTLTFYISIKLTFLIKIKYPVIGRKILSIRLNINRCIKKTSAKYPIIGYNNYLISN
ncbi:hypothetical protein SAMN03097699_3103 [Flavobacteriaceae bacterium MAR_2010_188]|nr:hypothetical protein SAMN03097699_3103 [Flavobacteriaceae bacterium MAR_2010_188]